MSNRKQILTLIRCLKQVYHLRRQAGSAHLDTYLTLMLSRTLGEARALKHEYLVAWGQAGLPAEQSLTCPPDDDKCEPPDIGDPPE